MNLSEKLWYLNMAMGIYGCGMYIFLHVIAKSEIPKENLDELSSSPICEDMAECHKMLQNRLETVESAVRAIVAILSIQKSEVFIPINNMLAQHQAIREILSRSEIEVIRNSVDLSTFVSGPNFTVGKIISDIAKEYKDQGDNVENLKGVIKCSIENLIETNIKGATQSTHIKAVVTNESLEIIWPVLSVECRKFSSGVWIRVFEASDDDSKLPEEIFLSIPQNCILNHTDNSNSIVLFPQSTLNDENDSCFFFLARNLTQCRAYVVEVIENYQSLRGKILRTEIVVPPKQSDEFSMKPLISVAVQNSNSLIFNWEDNSGCAPQLTSFNLKIFQDGIVDNRENDITTIRIPRSCLKHPGEKENLFSLQLPADEQNICQMVWKPLDKCRKYRLDVSSQYSSWNSPSSSLEIFTGQEGHYPVNINNFLRCPKEYHYCPFRGCRLIQPNCISECDTQCDDCEDVMYRDTNCTNDRFRCGEQCLPVELVCDGKYDCLDGSDEGYDCSYAYMCQEISSASNHFSSQIFPKPALEIHSERVPDVVRKTAVLISAERNHQIWLTFNKFDTYKDKHFVKVYDGSYSSSPLLLSHSGSNRPYSVRSSSNDLFVEFPSYYDMNYGIEASYTSINHTDEPFVPGCGGYINGDDVISTSNNLSATGADCFWFIESWNSEDSFLLRRNKTLEITTMLSHFVYPTMTVYDGWNTNGLLLYNSNQSDVQEAVIFSITNKMLVHFQQSDVKEYRTFYWNVSMISTPQCRNHYEGTSGTIKSPNYPMPYPNLTDCRWTITVKPGSKVRLLFAFFETQEGGDLISVYDGPTVHSILLLSKSGSVPTPFVVTSSTNKVLVRFTSDGDTSLPGFLAVYSSV